MALRYLRAPKSHTAVNAISIISVVGVAVATAAIVCVLSVFNGFHEVLGLRLDRLSPDVEVSPASGKVIADADSLALLLEELPETEVVMPALADNALVIANSREMPVKLKGVDLAKYSHITAIDSMGLDGIPMPAFAEDGAAVSVGVAQRLGIYSAGQPMLVFAPRREGRINLANPMESFVSDSISVDAIFQSMQSEVDENTVICDIELVRDLFQYTTEATALEIKGVNGIAPPRLASKIRVIVGDEYVVKDRLMLQQTNFRMVSIEKWITFLLLIFILMIASFNIISTLCMIVIEKQGALSVLSAMGMNRRRIGRTFWWESIYISLAGGVAGIVVGVVLCLIQEHFGIIKLGGDPSMMVMTAYPVVVKWSDIGLAMVPVLVIGMICAWIASSFARSRI